MENGVVIGRDDGALRLPTQLHGEFAGAFFPTRGDADTVGVDLKGLRNLTGMQVGRQGDARGQGFSAGVSEVWIRAIVVGIQVRQPVHGEGELHREVFAAGRRAHEIAADGEVAHRALGGRVVEVEGFGTGEEGLHVVAQAGATPLRVAGVVVAGVERGVGAGGREGEPTAELRLFVQARFGRDVNAAVVAGGRAHPHRFAIGEHEDFAGGIGEG